MNGAQKVKLERFIENIKNAKKMILYHKERKLESPVTSFRLDTKRKDYINKLMKKSTSGKTRQEFVQTKDV